MKIKFCGMMHKDDIEAANRIRPNLVGFILAEGFRRSRTPEQIRELAASLDPSIRKVGVFVDQDPAWIASLLDEKLIDIVQLHGHESDEEVVALSKLAPVIQAFVIRNAGDLQAAAASQADYVLLDAGKGDGTVFDWSLLKDFRRPFLLAGGLDAANLKTAMALQPWGLDVSSGIETNGRKDAKKMAAFAQAVKEAMQ